MEYFYSIYLHKLIPYEIYKKILDYEWSEQKWHVKLELDSYVIKNKFTVCRQISKTRRDVAYIDCSIRWNNIILFKRQFT